MSANQNARLVEVLIDEFRHSLSNAYRMLARIESELGKDHATCSILRRGCSDAYAAAKLASETFSNDARKSDQKDEVADEQAPTTSWLDQQGELNRRFRLLAEADDREREARRARADAWSYGIVRRRDADPGGGAR